MRYRSKDTRTKNYRSSLTANNSNIWINLTNLSRKYLRLGRNQSKIRKNIINNLLQLVTNYSKSKNRGIQLQM